MKSKLLLIAAIITFNACKKENVNADGKPVTGSSSFYPMQIGNYWKMSNNDYTEITDTLRISGKLFYRFQSLIGGDAMSTRYLRIDENQDLVEASSLSSGELYTQAKFGARVGDVFNTSNDGSGNNFAVKVVVKSDIKMSFTLDAGHTNFETLTSNVTYYKGIGPDDKYKAIKINGKVYNY
jgi:hypothetical protein